MTHIKQYKHKTVTIDGKRERVFIIDNQVYRQIHDKTEGGDNHLVGYPVDRDYKFDAFAFLRSYDVESHRIKEYEGGLMLTHDDRGLFMDTALNIDIKPYYCLFPEKKKWSAKWSNRYSREPADVILQKRLAMHLCEDYKIGFSKQSDDAYWFTPIKWDEKDPIATINCLHKLRTTALDYLMTISTDEFREFLNRIHPKLEDIAEKEAVNLHKNKGHLHNLQNIQESKQKLKISIDEDKIIRTDFSDLDKRIRELGHLVLPTGAAIIKSHIKSPIIVSGDIYKKDGVNTRFEFQEAEDAIKYLVKQKATYQKIIGEIKKLIEGLQ